MSFQPSHCQIDSLPSERLVPQSRHAIDLHRGVLHLNTSPASLNFIHFTLPGLSGVVYSLRIFDNTDKVN